MSYKLTKDWLPQQDDAAAAGLRAVEKRVSSVPNAVQDFLQAWSLAPATLHLVKCPLLGLSQNPKNPKP